MGARDTGFSRYRMMVGVCFFPFPFYFSFSFFPRVGYGIESTFMYSCKHDEQHTRSWWLCFMTLDKGVSIFLVLVMHDILHLLPCMTRVGSRCFLTLTL